VSEGSAVVDKLIKEANQPVPAALPPKKRKKEDKQKEKDIAASALEKHRQSMLTYKKVLGSFLHS